MKFILRAGPPFWENTILSGSVLSERVTIAGDVGNITISARDWRDNVITLGEDFFSVVLTGLSLSDCPFISSSDLDLLLTECPGLLMMDATNCRRLLNTSWYSRGAVLADKRE